MENRNGDYGRVYIYASIENPRKRNLFITVIGEK